MGRNWLSILLFNFYGNVKYTTDSFCWLRTHSYLAWLILNNQVFLIFFHRTWKAEGDIISFSKLWGVSRTAVCQICWNTWWNSTSKRRNSAHPGWFILSLVIFIWLFKVKFWYEKWTFAFPIGTCWTENRTSPGVCIITDCRRVYNKMHGNEWGGAGSTTTGTCMTTCHCSSDVGTPGPIQSQALVNFWVPW